MDSVARRILLAFEELNVETADLAALSSCVGTDLTRLEAAAESMVRDGLLRFAAAGNLARTEDGRLAVAEAVDVTLYTRAGCHLCDEAKAVILPLVREVGARLREVNVDSDPLLAARYTDDVPVVFLGSRKVAKHRLDAVRFRRQLADAARPRS